MTIAYWCVLIIIIFPYIFTILAKSGAHFNNHDPRTYLQNITGWRKRANYVQLNSFEIMAPFGISVVIAHLAHASQSSINSLALAFIITRIIYALCYLFDYASLRTLFWTLGLVCIVCFYVVSVI